MAGLRDRLKHAWNVFASREEDRDFLQAGGGLTQYGGRPDRNRMRFSNERSIISSIYTRLSVDIAGVPIKHVRVDDQDRFMSVIHSGLNDCLNFEANPDQAGRQFRQDIAATVIEHGVAAIVPVDTNLNPKLTGGFDIETMRVGTVVEWKPYHVKVNVFNIERQLREDVTLPKKMVAIVENPLYAMMNEPNSTLQRLIRKLNQLDAIDEQSSSGKLDIIIQLPYQVRSESKRTQAEQRRKDLEFQLKDSQYGVAYADATEKITQLNRPAENNMMTQIEYLTKMLYGQLGLTEAVMLGTASEEEILNYWNRTIEPMMDAIVEAMRRSFLTKTARTQKQNILYFRDPFKLVPMAIIAEIADKFTRNEILASNEIRQAIGYAPSKDPKADQLVNSNMPQGDTGVVPPDAEVIEGTAEDDIMSSAFDEIEAELDRALAEVE